MQDEDTLIKAAEDGDQESFEILFHRYRAYVYTIAWKVTLHDEDAMDVTQNTFALAAAHLGDFKGEGTFRAWLAVIAAHEACTLRRRPHTNRETLTSPFELNQITDNAGNHVAPNQRDLVDRTWQRNRLDAAMSELTPQQRAILALNVTEDMGPSKIAVHLDIPAKQVRSQMARAIERLRNLLAPQNAPVMISEETGRTP